ncbi:MAG: hypothetical protein RL728_956, partial [Bacteroidota bacterium]
MEAKFSPRVKDVIGFSREEAVRLGNEFIAVEHVLLGIIRQGNGTACKLLFSFNLDLEKIKNELELGLRRNSNLTNDLNANIPLVKQAEKVLKKSFLEAKLSKSEQIGTEHLLLSILREEDCVATSILNKYGIIYDIVRDELDNMMKNENLPRAEFPGSSDEEGENFGAAQRKSADPKSKTPVLDNFGRDLTKMAEQGRLDPIVGRESEIERVSQILSRRKKNNPILIGEPGVGKSAIAEGLALRIVQRKVSRILFN